MDRLEEEPFHNSEITTILVVADMHKAKHFYIDQVGAQLHRSYGGTSLVLKFLGHWFLLVTEGGPTADKPDVHFKSLNERTNIGHAFTIRVEDCQKSYNILRKRGVTFITPPYDWGAEIRCFFYDPDGHLFEISQLQ